MFSLQTLRNAHHLTRFVLVWFVLFVGVAVASPWVKTEATQLVCSAEGGLKRVAAHTMADGEGAPAAHTALDCPACLPVIAPPAPEVRAQRPAGDLSHVLQPQPAARLASALGQAWQARAPPAFFA